MTGFQRLCLITCVVVFVLIIIGGTVRATGSGLGCPDWPTCHGNLIPDGNKHTIIEYSHRLTASIAGFLVLAMAIVALKSYRRVPAILYPVLAAFGLILFQAALGGAVVVNDLPPEIVTVHLGTALTILFILVLITVTTFAVRQPLTSITVSRNYKRLAAAGIVITFLLMLIGAYIAGAGYGLACSGWPECNGQLIPTAHAASVQIEFLHRVVALLLGIVLLALLAQGWRERGAAPFAFVMATAAFALYIVQALIGASNVWTQLSDEASIGHLACGTLLWLVLGMLNIRVYALYDLLQHSSPTTVQGRLAKVSR